MSEPYDTKFLEDCPDCGGILEGNVCHECEAYWEVQDSDNTNKANGGEK